MIAGPKLVARAVDATATETPAFLARIRLRAKRRVMWMSAVWNQGQLHDRLAISPDDVNRILADPEDQAASENAFYRTDPAGRELASEIELRDAEFDERPEWLALKRHCGLTDFEADLLSLAVAAAVDPWLRRVYGYLHDDASVGGATPWLTATLFQREPAVLSPDSALLESHLARPMDPTNAWAMNAIWNADPYALHWLEGRRATDPELSHAIEWIPAAASEAKVCLYPAQLEEILGFARAAMRSIAAAVQVELIAARGAGKRTLAGQVAASLGADLIAVDAAALLPPDVPPSQAEERIARVLRMATLEGAMLYWQDTSTLTTRLWRRIANVPGVTLLGAEKAGGAAGRPAATGRAFHLPPLRRENRLALWDSLTRLSAPASIGDWVLSPAEIAAAARLAPAGPEIVARACRESLEMAPNDLFQPLGCPFTWDDIILPYYLRQHLAELEQQVRLRWQVYEEWGFERLCPLGRGITALFAGPSGTGKTMAAQVLARALNLRLYRVDLSGVVNKYIGETEKRLKQVFDACERANVLLFFDEADAVFGQRTQVKDSHDRYANIHVDYLLQRMEQFDGIAILATNRKGDLDKAFLRRIRFILDFVPPGPAERMAMWRRCLVDSSPKGEPLLDSIDWDMLSQKLTLTGADIAAAALSAAFLARSEGCRIGMSQVVHAVRRQMNKQGVALRMGDLEG